MAWKTRRSAAYGTMGRLHRVSRRSITARRAVKYRGSQTAAYGSSRDQSMGLESTPIHKRFREISNKNHIFQRSFNLDTVTSTGAATDVLLAYTFYLSQLNGYTEFTNLFDEYKIINVHLEARPFFNGQSISEIGVPGPFIQTVLAYVDHNDATAPADSNEMWQHSSDLIKWQLHQNKTFDFIPHIQQRTYISAIADGYSSVAPKWIPTVNYDVVHYGLKMYIPPTGAANAYPYFNLYCTLTFACRNVK